MIRIELSTLISKLNVQSKLALEQAASICIEQQASEVTLEHYLEALLDNPLSDFRILLKNYGIESEAVRERLKTVNDKGAVLETYPAFSPLLVELLQEAWLLSSTELDQRELRSGAIFLASQLRSRYLSPDVMALFDAVDPEYLKKHFDEVLKDSAENARPDQPEVRRASLSDSSFLSKYCTDVTKDAREGKLDPVLCREDELNLMIDILCRRRKNNPIVVGDAGVGKSAMIEGLALRVMSGNVPALLKEVEIYALDLGLLQAGASVKGEFEKRLKGVIDEITHSPERIILFIDEAHTLIGSGNSEGGSDAANLLKPALARGELSTIAATTWKEYKKYFEKDPALSRRFQLVKIEEPGVRQAEDIMRGISHVYEKAHGVLITQEALKASAELSARYISGRQLPDKAIDVLDTACARIAINLTTPPKKLMNLEMELERVRQKITMFERGESLGERTDISMLQQLNELADTLSLDIERMDGEWQYQKELVEAVIDLRTELSSEVEDEKPLQEQLHTKLAALDDISHEDRLVWPHVGAEQVAQVIADWTGVPVEQMSADELHKITHLQTLLKQHIKGQEKAIACIHDHLLTARADLRLPGRPVGSFLLVGPSGVGKTETVVQIAEQLYGGKQFLTTINMSEFQEKHTVSRLIGSPPGYVGYGEGGVLTEAIRKMPYSIVLLDEVEKAHPDVLNLFYQAFDKGELSDGEGRLIDCKNILFFMTSNLGYQTIIDFAGQPELLEEELYAALVPFFKPALLARMEIVPYMPLDQDALTSIIKGKLSYLKATLSARYGAQVIIDEALVNAISERAMRNENGARMLEAIIEGQLLPPVSLALLNKLVDKAPVHTVHLSVNESGDFSGRVK